MSGAYDILLKRYGSFTDIQKRAFPIVASGKNCVIIAPTGSGKTEAATIPILEKLSRQGNAAGVRLLYITPLRALNRDMVKRFSELCSTLGISVAVRHGDTLPKERARQARSAPSVLITTPETLQSILPAKTIRDSLRSVSAVVVDEVHELYYNKRGAQLSLGLERLEELAPSFQRIAISATVGVPETISRFLCGARDCAVVSSDDQKRIKLRVELPTKSSGKNIETMEKFGLDESSMARLEAIASNIKTSKTSLIFANTRQIVEALGSRLVYLNSISPFGGIGVHHSSLDKEERISLENRFKEGKLKSIIATSSLELGIDIGSIDMVMQYGSPRQALRLIQRAGRSGHTVKGVPNASIICTSAIDSAEATAISMNARDKQLEKFDMQRGALDVLANQLCGIALDKGKCRKEEALAIVRRSPAYSSMDPIEFNNLLEFMSRQRLIGFDGSDIYSGPATRMYYYGHLSVIPDRKRYIVKTAVDNRTISSLDEFFVVNSVEENSVFITKGLPWRVISIDDNVISVEPSTDLEAAVPDWVGEDIPVSREAATRVFELLANPSSGNDITDRNAAESIALLSESQSKSGMPSGRRLLIEDGDGYSIVYTGLGTLANEALSRLIAHEIVTKTGKSINVKSSPYMIFVEAGGDLTTDVRHIISSIKPASIEGKLYEAVRDTELFRYKFITIAKLFGAVDKEASISRSLAKRLLKLFEDTPIHRETIRELMQNYFDIKSMQDMSSKIESGAIRIERIRSPSLSPLSKAILDSAYYTKELIMPLLPSDVVIDSFIAKAMSKSVNLLCTYCGFRFKRKLSELKGMDKINCPSCSSPMITFDSDEFYAVVAKRAKGAKLSHQEITKLKGAMKIASLLEAHGGKAAIALSTYGIGPASAARALRMLRREDRMFYMDLIEAQKNFIKTKKYWSA
jgi:ATP-dependent Lhr-like helicase